MRLVLYIALFYSLLQLAHAESRFAHPRLPHVLEEVKNTDCLSKVAPTIYEMEEYLKMRFDDSKKETLILDSQHAEVTPFKVANRTLYDFYFTLVKENYDLINIVINQELTREHPESFPELNRKVVACETPLCVMELMYGHDQAVFALYMMAKYEVRTLGVPFIGIGKRSSVLNWNEKRRNPLMIAFQTMPKKILNKIRSIRQKHALSALLSSADSSQGEGVVADMAITLYPLWQYEYLGDYLRIDTVLHELGHSLDSRLGEKDPLDVEVYSQQEPWLTYSGWKKTNGKWLASYPDKINPSEPHYQSAPWEDMAQSIADYIHNPSLVQSYSIEKYNFIKNQFFSGIEFNTLNQCIGSTPDELRSLASDWMASLVEIELPYPEAVKECYGNLSIGPKATPAFNQCVSDFVISRKFLNAKAQKKLYDIIKTRAHPDLIIENIRRIVREDLEKSISLELISQNIDVLIKSSPNFELYTESKIRSLSEAYVLKEAQLVPEFASFDVYQDKTARSCSIGFTQDGKQLSDQTIECLALQLVCSFNRSKASSSFINLDVFKTLLFLDKEQNLNPIYDELQSLFNDQMYKTCFKTMKESPQLKKLYEIFLAEWNQEINDISSLNVTRLKSLPLIYSYKEMKSKCSLAFIKNQFKPNEALVNCVTDFLIDKVESLSDKSKTLRWSMEGYTNIFPKSDSKKAYQAAIEQLRVNVSTKEMPALLKEWKSELKTRLSDFYLKEAQLKKKHQRRSTLSRKTKDLKYALCSNLSDRVDVYDLYSYDGNQGIKSLVKATCQRIQDRQKHTTYFKEKDLEAFISELGLAD